MKRAGLSGSWIALVLALLLATVLPAVAQEDESAPEAGTGLALVEERPATEEDALSADETELADEPPAPEITRITFDVPFPVEKGGGTARGSAGEVEYLGDDQIIATDAVEFTYQNMRVLAEMVAVDLQSKQVLAEGNVILDEGPTRVAGSRLEYDLESRKGTVFEAEAFADPDMFLTGAQINKETDTVYTITDGTVTSCSEDVTPDWSFKLGRGRVNLDGWARIKNTTLRVKKMPVLYLPYLLFPARSERTSGFLFPNIGFASDRGERLGLAWYQTLGRSYDATIFADIYSEDFFGLGGEFRYAPTQGTRGLLQMQFIDDPTQGPDDEFEAGTRWKLSADHASEDLPWGLRGVVRIRDFSDFEYFRDFERDFNNISIRTLWSSAFVSGNWGSHGLNVLVDKRETFIRSGVTVLQRQLPEIEYRLRPMQLGKAPLYLELLSSFNVFDVSRTDVLSEQYWRTDLAPRLTLPISPAPWISLSVSAAGRLTHYENSLTPDRLEFSGESLTRTLPSASAQMIGPSFSRVFDWKIGRFGKFKHVIEPRVTYLRIDEFDDQALVPSFDEVDALRDQELYTISLVNRLLAKPADEDSPEGAREILSLEIGQAFSLRDDVPFQEARDSDLETTDGPIGAKLRYVPSERTNIELRTTYNTLFDKVESASLLGGARWGQQAVGVSWIARVDAERDFTTSHQARLYTDFTLIRARLKLASQVNVDLEENFLQSQRHILTYTSQCYGVRFEWRELARELTGAGQETVDEWSIAISLKNIGTFLDLNGGDHNGFRR